MKKTIVNLLAALTVIGAPLAAAFPTTANAPLTKAEEDQFYAQLQAGMKKTQDRVQQLQARGGVQGQMAAANAQATLSIKQTMYSNFKGTPAIQFPEIRNSLLSLFQKDEVTAEDLVSLQQAIHDWEQSAKR